MKQTEFQLESFYTEENSIIIQLIQGFFFSSKSQCKSIY